MILPASLLAPSGVPPVMGVTLPENSNDGYVAAAYIVFFALVLIYVAIMAIRLGRVERKLEALRGDANHDSHTRRGRTTPDEDPAPPTLIHPHPEGASDPQGTEQERETV
jgi:hypothetical protein